MKGVLTRLAVINWSANSGRMRRMQGWWLGIDNYTRPESTYPNILKVEDNGVLDSLSHFSQKV